LECSYEEKTSHEKGIADKKESQTEKARKAREAGEKFRLAALGEYVKNKKQTTNKRLSLSSSSSPDDDDDDDENNNNENMENLEMPPTGKKSSTHHASLRNLANVAMERAQAKTLKEQNKKAKIDAWKEVKMQQLELDKQRLEIEKERASNDRLMMLQILDEIKKQKE
jgi:hypothetical protein